MSHTRSTHVAAAATDPSQSATGAAAQSPRVGGQATPRKTWPCRLGLLAMAVWSAALISLALFSANPVTLSEPQIQQAQFVVTGIPEADSGLLVVERTWWGDLPEGKVLVTNLEDVQGLQAGTAYIVPLTQVGENYRVTTLVEQSYPPRVYPASQAAIARLKPLLRARKPTGN